MTDEPVPTDEPVSTDAGDPAETEPARARPLPRPGAVVAWAVGTALLIGLDGWTGLAVGVVIAAVSLAGFPRRVLGALGVGFLAAAPLVLLLEGLPGRGSISPQWVADRLATHHLVFAGVVLSCVHVLVDLVGPEARAHHGAAARPEEELIPAPWARPTVAWGLVALVAIGALLAVAAVFG